MKFPGSFDEKSMNGVKQRVYGRRLIRAHVKKIQLALASYIGPSPKNPRTLSVPELPNELGIINWFLQI